MKTFHPYALIFPPITGEAFDLFCADIEKRGLLFPIILHEDGTVLEGRHREMACDKTGVDPGEYITFRQSAADVAAGKTYDESALDLVMSANAHRRQLTEDQKLVVAVEYKKAFEAEAAKRQKTGKPDTTKIAAADRRSDARSAKAAGVSGRSKVNAAEKILEAATPEDREAVKKGEKSLKQVAPKKPKAEKAKPSAPTILSDAFGPFGTALRSVTNRTAEFTTEDAKAALVRLEKTADLMRELKKALELEVKRHGSSLHKGKGKAAVAAELGR